jgi:hypothetical protein
MDMEDPLLSQERKDQAAKQVRDPKGHFVPLSKLEQKISSTIPSLLETNPKETKDHYPKLVSFSITNPITYLKYWWGKVIGNEGVDVRLKVKPLTAIAIVAIIASGTFSLGLLVRFANQTPIIKYIPAFAASPTPDPFRDTAYSGMLRVAGDKYYLVTTDAEAITLSAPTNIDLSKYVGRRIFATGRYNKETGILNVIEASDLELLPSQISPVPTSISY